MQFKSELECNQSMWYADLFADEQAFNNRSPCRFASNFLKRIDQRVGSEDSSTFDRKRSFSDPYESIASPAVGIDRRLTPDPSARCLTDQWKQLAQTARTYKTKWSKRNGKWAAFLSNALVCLLSVTGINVALLGS